MSIEFVLFFILAIAAIASALGMLMSRSAVYAALFLVLNFSTVAVFYILLNAPFIAMSQITVYAGAIMVLFLFVIMLLGTESLPRAKCCPGSDPWPSCWQCCWSGRLPTCSSCEARPAAASRSRWRASAARGRWDWRCSTSTCCPSRSPRSCCWWPWWAPSCLRARERQGE